MASRRPELKLLAWRADDNKRPLWESMVDGEEVVRVRVLRDEEGVSCQPKTEARDADTVKNAS